MDQDYRDLLIRLDERYTQLAKAISEQGTDIRDLKSSLEKTDAKIELTNSKMDRVANKTAGASLVVFGLAGITSWVAGVWDFIGSFFKAAT